MATWVAALDGGGTKTAMALADCRGAVSILPEGPGCNPQDGPAWEPVLREAIARIRRASGGLATAVLGLPGFGEVQAHDAAVVALLREHLQVSFEPMNDVFLAHLGAFGGGAGVLVLSGTGSMAVARGPAGMVRVGGWGDILGDEGSAGWIGREALASAGRAMDGRFPSGRAFADALVARLGRQAEGPFAPLTWLMAQPGTPRAAMAAVARHVDALAEEGQEMAAVILKDAADTLAWQAKTAARLAGLPEPFLWVPAGGTFKSRTLGSHLRDWLGPPESPRLTTLAGGLLRAAELAGWSPDDVWAAHVDAQLRAWA